MHRHGVLELLVMLAERSKTLIRSDWTDAYRRALIEVDALGRCTTCGLRRWVAGCSRRRAAGG
jgi:hypothetical protein